MALCCRTKENGITPFLTQHSFVEMVATEWRFSSLILDVVKNCPLVESETYRRASRQSWHLKGTLFTPLELPIATNVFLWRTANKLDQTNVQNYYLPSIALWSGTSRTSNSLRSLSNSGAIEGWILRSHLSFRATSEVRVTSPLILIPECVAKGEGFSFIVGVWGLDCVHLACSLSSSVVLASSLI